MAVAEQTRVDPTAGIIQAIINMGGTKEKTSSSTSVDPAALGNLQNILNQQMQGTTQEGASALLRAIFQGGLEQVPGLATTYAQAAGARSSNNSPLATAMQDMMLKLTQEGSKQLAGNQVNAANTAKTIAESTKTTNTTGTKAPKASAIQLAPFLLGAASKFKNGIPGFDQAVSQFDNFITGGSPLPAPVFNAGGGGLNLGSLAGQSADMFGFDFGSSPALAAISSSPDFGFGGSDAMGFDFGSSVGSSVASDVGSSIFDTAGTDFLEGGFLGFEKGGLVGRDGKVRYKKNMKRKGYASGGYITADRSDNLRDRSGQAIRGSTINEGVSDVIPNILLRGNAAALSPRAELPMTQKPLPGDMGSFGESSIGSGLATGQVATPEEAAAAALGFGLTIGSVPLGLPSAIGIGIANALGFPATPISPISPLVNALVGFFSGSSSGNQGMTEGQAHGAAMGDPDANQGGLAGMGVTMGLSAEDAAASIGGGFGGGDTGVDGSASVGDAADAGVGGGGFARGGEVNGPKGKDVIPILATDGEYIIQEEVVQALGVPFFDAINAMFAGAQRGR